VDREDARVFWVADRRRGARDRLFRGALAEISETVSNLTKQCEHNMKHLVFSIFVWLLTLQGSAQRTKPRIIVDDEKTFQYIDSTGTTSSYLSQFSDSLSVPPMMALDGHIIGPEYTQGKTVVYNFWFTSCKPCVAEMPVLNRLSAAYRSDSVVFIGITFDDKEKVEKFLSSKPFDFTIARLSLDAIQKLKKVSLFPLTMILDRHRRLRFVIFGRQTKNDDDEAFYEVLDLQIKKALVN
jgi:thiol-disulfide isomerase/thioredoxin